MGNPEDKRELDSGDWQYAGPSMQDESTPENAQAIRNLLDNMGSENVRIFSDGVWVRKNSTAQNVENVLKN